MRYRQYFLQEKQLCQDNDLLQVIFTSLSFGKESSSTEKLRSSVRMYAEKMLGFSWHEEGMTEKVTNPSYIDPQEYPAHDATQILYPPVIYCPGLYESSGYQGDQPRKRVD